MRKLLGLLFVGLFLGGCMQQQQYSGPAAPQNDPVTSDINATGKDWADAAIVSDSVAIRKLLPLKNTCGEKTLTWEYGTAFPADEIWKVWLNPGKVDIRLKTYMDAIYDVVFSEDCKEIYVVARVWEGNNPRTEIRSYNIKSRKWTSLSHTLFPMTNIIEDAVPAPRFIYPINKNQLFIYAKNPTTGGDAYTDQTSKGIFDIQKGTVEWLELGGGLPPVVFQPKKGIFSVFPLEEADGTYTIYRTDIHIPDGEKEAVELLSGTNFDELVTKFWGSSLHCNRVNFEGSYAYADCMDAFWKNAFPAS